MITEDGKSVVIVYGRSQMGKSTTISKLICDQERKTPVISKKSGKSCTKDVEIYQTIVGPMMDLPGYDDTDLELDAEDVAKLLSIKLTESRTEGVRFLVFESVADSTIQLRASVAELVKAYGKSVKGSIVVIATKMDLADEDDLPDRLKNIKDDMLELGIGEDLVTWQNKKISDDLFSDQVTLLRQIILKKKIVCTKQLEELTTRISKRAQELYDSQSPKIDTKMVVIDEIYNEKREVIVEYLEQYTKKVPVEESYKVEEKYDIIKGRWHPIAKLGVSLISLGVTAAFGVGEGHNKEKTRWITESRIVQKDIIKTRKAFRKFSLPETKVRQVNKQEEVKNFLPLETFIPVARLEIINQIRASLCSKNSKKV